MYKPYREVHCHLYLSDLFLVKEVDNGYVGITISDYGATSGYTKDSEGKPLAKSSIFTTKYDKIRIIGTNGAIGFHSLIQQTQNYEVWDG